jgi:hypothetical protein
MFEDMKIGTKLSLGFALVLVLLIAVAGSGLNGASRMDDHIMDVVNDKNVKVNKGNQMMSGSSRSKLPCGTSCWQLMNNRSNENRRTWGSPGKSMERHWSNCRAPS